MWNKKKIKNIGVAAVITACIFVATGTLSYSIGKSQSKTYSMVEKKETAQSKTKTQKKKVKKEVNIKGGITLEEAKKIAIDYHIKNGGTKDDFKWEDTSIDYRGDDEVPLKAYYYIGMRPKDSDSLLHYEVYFIHPTSGKVIGYSMDDSEGGTTNKERICEKVICDDASKLGYAPVSWDNIEKIYKQDQYDGTTVRWRDMSREQEKILKRAYNKDYKNVVKQVVKYYNIGNVDDYEVVGAAVDSELGTYSLLSDKRVFCRDGIMFNLKFKNGLEVNVWFDQVTRKLRSFEIENWIGNM